MLSPASMGEVDTATDTAAGAAAAYPEPEPLADALGRAVALIPHYATPAYAALRAALAAGAPDAELLAAAPLLGRGALR